MVRVSSVRRRFALAGVVALVSAGLAGCSATNTITTQMDYAASDGVRATLGDVTAQNLLIITAGEGEEGALQGAFTNAGRDDLTVTLSTEDDVELAAVPVAAGATVLLGGSSGDIVTFTSPGAPGAAVPLVLSTGAAGAESIFVPVLDGTLSEYADLVPTASPSPSATPTAEATEAPSAEPTPTASPTAG
ncbi:hypothetical protein [Cellulomonas chengniuliangii]|uniref:Lipoprotein n=1 Tax=Cellulomonas chengniuliangii TaxID=2968084 RepID=A0ABY5L5J5_9CELL|nr:hypothetical protein [Cellulomonas chengniuliangii]MCC2307348.1 hypothetical protein [Cellulomonas chengniuliangii]MCC2317756.1 hypothetical protein [Cellulomonas chengniuliangii]UUI75863.1 hypothetical protein NP064_02835 [Cellulomonas chengniuliangii]